MESNSVTCTTYLHCMASERRSDRRYGALILEWELCSKPLLNPATRVIYAKGDFDGSVDGQCIE